VAVAVAAADPRSRKSVTRTNGISAEKIHNRKIRDSLPHCYFYNKLRLQLQLLLQLPLPLQLHPIKKTA
jgi:hypothetical protein